jgi:D-alanine-D-alanine ligase
MRIGITYDLKSNTLPPAGTPDDFQEEFDTPATIEAIAAVLRGLGHTVEKLGDGRELLQRLLADPPDFVFNFAEGQGIGRSREARVPAVLEMLCIPYSGSDPLTMAVTLDKNCAKRLVAACGVAVAQGYVVDPEDRLQIANCKLQIANSMSDLQFAICNLQFPVIVKPAWEGSSKGIRGNSIVDRVNDLPNLIKQMRRNYQQPILVEEYIVGDELTVGVVGNDTPEIIGIMRVVPREPNDRFVYGLDIKRDYKRLVRYECPAPLSDKDEATVCDATMKTWNALGCRDVARIDFRLRGGVPYFLEVNPLPGLNPADSDLVILSKLAGWTYERLIGRILEAAIDREYSAAAYGSEFAASCAKPQAART